MFAAFETIPHHQHVVCFGVSGMNDVIARLSEHVTQH